MTPQVLGAVVRRYGHFDLAEDATQEALLAAAAMQWPRDGLPDNPKGWLITVAVAPAHRPACAPSRRVAAERTRSPSGL